MFVMIRVLLQWQTSWTLILIENVLETQIYPSIGKTYSDGPN
jgi:hypothetical protein